MRKTADVVVIGGGAAGTSVAYHLGKLGVKNVVLVEQNYTPFGGTGRCAAHFRQQFGSVSNCLLGIQSVKEFDTLEEETGFDLEISKHGYLMTAYTEEHMEQLRKDTAMQNELGIPTVVLDPQGCKEVSPYLNIDGIVGGTHSKNDGHINPMKMALAYKSGAERYGVEFNNYTKVLDIQVENGKVKAVVTDKGTIETPCVVNAAGEWGKYIGRMAGVAVPVEPEKHQIVITEPLDYIYAPMIYSHKHGSYIAQVKHGGFLMGFSDPDIEAGIIDFNTEWRYLEKLSRIVCEQVPALKNVRIVRHWAGQYGNCPDQSIILGPVPEVEGFICALGCTKATMFAPVIGTLTSEIVAGKEPTLPLAPYLIDRFAKGEYVIDPALV